MSRSNYNKPFYVDVGTSIVAIRCASNHDVIFEYDFAKCPQVIQFTKDACDRMNREAEIGRPRRNCDVGTAEEQDKRFAYQFCRVGIEGCIRCKLNTLKHRGNTCGIHWAQMPYEEGGTK